MKPLIVDNSEGFSVYLGKDRVAQFVQATKDTLFRDSTGALRLYDKQSKEHVLMNCSKSVVRRDISKILTKYGLL